MNDLTNIDRKLIELMAEGLTNKQMADHFYKATEKSIDKARSRLFRKLGVKNGPHLISWSYKNKILS